MRNLAFPILAAAVAFTGAAGASDFDQKILDAHNRERASLSLPQLAWSDKLAQDAAGWAAHLAALGHAEHSKPDQRGHEGESLWQGTAGAYGPDEMVAGWVAEKKDFVYGTFPAVIKAGDWHAVGHYTQIVWRNTKEIGCAKATAGAWDILVCRYSPAGNLIGEKPY